MAAFAPRVLAPALLERDDFGTAALFENLGRHHGTGDARLTEGHVVAAHDQDFAELDDFAWLAGDLIDLEHVIGGRPILLAAGFEDCEHLFPRVLSRRSDLIVRTGFFQSM
jgi:hypothetical protein